MENVIKYYYNLTIESLNTLVNGFLFNTNDEIYYLELSDYSAKRISEVFELNRKMINYDVLIHEIILNKFNQIVTLINNKPYILMRVNDNLNKKINMSDISYFSYLTYTLIDNKKISSWAQKWEKKIDYYEQQAYEIGKKYMVAMEYFNYYVGLGENAISYLRSIDSYYPSISFCHIRPSLNPLEFYNPFNFIIDFKVRDLSEFVKLKFFYDSIDLNEIDRYIKKERLSGIDINYFYARLLFPTYYFDLFEQIMDGKISENKIVDIVNKSKMYEEFLHNLGVYLSKFTKIDVIDWLNKKRLIT